MITIHTSLNFLYIIVFVILSIGSYTGCGQPPYVRADVVTLGPGITSLYVTVYLYD